MTHLLDNIAIRVGHTANVAAVVSETSGFGENDAPFIRTVPFIRIGLKIPSTFNNFPMQNVPNC